MSEKKFAIFVVLFLAVKPITGQFTDTNTIKDMINHAIVLYPDKTDSISYYANYIQEQSKKLSFPYGETYSYRLRGSYHWFNDHFDSALIYYQLFLLKASNYGYKTAEWLATIDIANVYMNIGQYTHAKKLYFESLTLMPGINPTGQNYSHLYNALASSYQYLNVFDSASYYYREAIRYDLLVQDSTRMTERKSNLAEVLMLMNNLAEAEKYLLECYHYNKKYNHVDALWYNYQNLGKVYLLKKEYLSSENYFMLAYQQSAKTSTPFKVAETLEGLSQLFRQKGDFKKALEYKHRADSVLWLSGSEKNAKVFSNLEKEYKISKKEKENYQLLLDLEKEDLKKRSLFTIIILLATLVLGIALALRNIIKKKNQLAAQNNIINQQKLKLSELNTEKNALISYVSHDLGSPLVNIALCTKALELKFFKPGLETEKKQLLKNIQESADYGYELIQKILNIEAVEAGSHSLEMTNIILKDFLEAVINSFTETAKAKNITIFFTHSFTTGNLFSDQGLLQRILENLLSNAIKFTPTGKKVRINVYQNHATTSISVQDEGPGITAEDEQKLFVRYTRLTNKPTGNEKSMGLGLYIVKRLANELNADIKVVTSLGQGSTFTIIL